MNTPAKSDGIVLLTRSLGCANCQSVKTVLTSLGVHFREVDVDENPAEALPYLEVKKSRTLPLMYVNGENVSSGLDCIEEVRNYAS